MKFQCRQCNTRYQVDENRLPKKQKIQVKCKKCANIITIDFSPPPLEEDSNWRQLLPSGLLYGDHLKQEVTGNFKKLYPMSHVMWKARQLVSDPKTDVKEIANLLQSDPALASRILKVANSAYFGFSGKISSIHRASVLLGAKLLVQIITMIGHSKMLGGEMPGYGINSGHMWRHALTVAVGAESIAKQRAPLYWGEAFLAGLLHDLGKMILDQYVLERQAAFNELSVTLAQPHIVAEQKVLGLDHAEICEALCLHWNLPSFVAEAIACHHLEDLSQASLMSNIIYAADHIANSINPTTLVINSGALPDGAIAFLQMGGAQIGELAQNVLEAVEKLEENTI